MGNPLKIRISHGRYTAIGPGKADLLDAVHQTGSISAAAKRMGMSYRRAWELIDAMNQCFQQPLVNTASGGSHGGGTQVTEYGFKILASYRAIEAKASIAASEELQVISSQLKDITS